ncbi:TetR/AcrR family transcriptional regulator [Domibacillus mangrovi]|uniref:TetR family transcriptional regulator n=1 Tax=Domibacillus mangrovi TaxID=1714354 RepID=A0A1Q5P350_9BACI|nr:TetR/AcrR family transcriptional regulator [Domibacillus mangrovi]OKL36603.1 TetR family transcriptional regulator [Domibacillus mangrovi]
MTKSSENDFTTKGNILNSALELIKTEEGLENITLRKIAALANVNVALINYHFGSKDKLINEALKVLLASFRETFLILDNLSIPPKERLKAFMVQYVNSVLKYPGLVREIGKGNISFESQFEYKNYMETTGFTIIKDTIKEITGEKNPDILFMMMMQIHAAIFFPSLMACKKNVSFIWNPIPIEEQIDYLFEHYFAKYF